VLSWPVPWTTLIPRESFTVICSPQNVLIRANGEAVLIDFGFARMNDGRDVDLTGEGAGSLDHMAPETWAGEAVGPAADVYGLCAIMLHLLTGHPPFCSRSPDDLAKQRRRANPARTAMACKGLAPDLRAILARGLARRPKDRHANAGVLALDIDALVDGKSSSSSSRTFGIRDVAGKLDRFLRRWFPL
jgi:serine/threonine protein kinase